MECIKKALNDAGLLFEEVKINSSNSNVQRTGLLITKDKKIYFIDEISFD